MIIDDLYKSTGAMRDWVMFLENLYLKGKKHNSSNHDLTPEKIIELYRKHNTNSLTIAVFYTKLCLREIPVNGKSIEPEMIRKLTPDSSKGRRSYIKFLEQLFFKGSMLNGIQYTLVRVPSEVNPDLLAGNTTPDKPNSSFPQVYPAASGDPAIQADDIADLYKNAGLNLDHAQFTKNLVLSGQKIIDDKTVLDLLNVSKATNSTKIDYLIQRISMQDGYDDTSRKEELCIEAINILNHSRLDNDIKAYYVKLKICILKYNLQNISETNSKLSPDSILKDIESITSPAKSSRLKFFFLTECFLESWYINDQPVSKTSLLNFLSEITGRGTRIALKHWLNEEIRLRTENRHNIEYSSGLVHRNRHRVFMEAGKVSSANAVSMTTDSIDYQQPDSQPGHAGNDSDDEPEFFEALLPEQFQNRIDNVKKPVIPLHQISDSCCLYLVIDIISSLNNIFAAPEIVVIGSFSRVLQNLDSHFADIDLMGTMNSIQQLGYSLSNKINQMK